MSIIYNNGKRSGITYAYESKSYWDKEKSSHAQKEHWLEGLSLKQVKLSRRTAAVKEQSLSNRQTDRTG